MNVLFISECEKRALRETRRILDQFAERRGSRTWQTAITMEGLNTVQRMLKRTARRNTAVACHWIRGRDHTELVWIIGDRRRFNAAGAVPTARTTRDVLRVDSENAWRNGELVQLLASMAALLHDLGKSTLVFQRRLATGDRSRNRIRHEWVSARMFEAFVGDRTDEEWLASLESGRIEAARWHNIVNRDGVVDGCAPLFAGFRNAPLGFALAWLVVTHHRALVPPQGDTPPYGDLRWANPRWNEQRGYDGLLAGEDDPERWWELADTLPLVNVEWRKRAAKLARRLAAVRRAEPLLAPIHDPFVMHLARLSLMLADHWYSSLGGIDSTARVRIKSRSPLMANRGRSDVDGNAGGQGLEEHVIGVAVAAGAIAHSLPSLPHGLPRLASVRRLRKRARSERFRWQDRAVDMISGLRENARQRGVFMINMASTGSGKTIANARLMYSLADPDRGMRCTIALGLRTLTRQTGEMLRSMMSLRDDELAIRVGGTPPPSLNEAQYSRSAQSSIARSAESERSVDDDAGIEERDHGTVINGSESIEPLMDSASTLLYDGAEASHLIFRYTADASQVRGLISAPVLVCTIDHLVPATDSARGGWQIAPMLRLMTSDLVLDEPDDFDLSDQPALVRLVFWAGMLGSRVLLSSATLPPALVEGLYASYMEGRRSYDRNIDSPTPVNDNGIQCVWIDEFNTSERVCSFLTDFSDAHKEFAKLRHAALTNAAKEPSQRAEIYVVGGTGKLGGVVRASSVITDVSAAIRDAAMTLHDRHCMRDRVSGKRVSFGLVRMANISPLIDVARTILGSSPPQGRRIHLCVYHSRFPQIVRSEIESMLDACLSRIDQESVFQQPSIRTRLDSNSEQDHMFIVLASPVAEVGRDHDYDWAVVEPSSMRSLIQVAGRVRRHRRGTVQEPNIAILHTNIRHLRSPAEQAFVRPGFEIWDQDELRRRGLRSVGSHDVRQIILDHELGSVDSRPRIIEPGIVQGTALGELAMLEHAVMRSWLLPEVMEPGNPRLRRLQEAGIVQRQRRSNASSWWNEPAEEVLLTHVMQTRYPFRRVWPPGEVELVFLLDEQSDHVIPHRIDRELGSARVTYVPCATEVSPIELVDSSGGTLDVWRVASYAELVRKGARNLGVTVQEYAKRYGVVLAPGLSEGGKWRYSEGFGIDRERTPDV